MEWFGSWETRSLNYVVILSYSAWYPVIFLKKEDYITPPPKQPRGGPPFRCIQSILFRFIILVIVLQLRAPFRGSLVVEIQLCPSAALIRLPVGMLWEFKVWFILFSHLITIAKVYIVTAVYLGRIRRATFYFSNTSLLCLLCLEEEIGQIHCYCISFNLYAVMFSDLYGNSLMGHDVLPWFRCSPYSRFALVKRFFTGVLIPGLISSYYGHFLIATLTSMDEFPPFLYAFLLDAFQVY